jgi:hypothetical protein
MGDFPVSNHRRFVCTKGTPHVAVSRAPDLCFVPGNPVAQPFPNHVETNKLAKGATTSTFIAGQPIWTKAGELGPPSEPAHAGVNKGKKSGTYRGEATASTYSKDLFAEGEPVVRSFDRTKQNHDNTHGEVIRTRFHHGLLDPANMSEFCEEYRKIVAKWATMTPAQRQAALQAAINKQLGKSGVPTVGVSASPLGGGRSGQFDFRGWTLEVDGGLMNKPALDSAGARALADTLYHEGRHAEQWWGMVRTQAGAKPAPTAAQISSSTGVPASVATAAVRAPLSGRSPAATFGSAMNRSVYGADAAYRNQVLTDLDAAGNGITAGQARLAAWNARNPSTLTAADRAQWNADYAQYQADLRKFNQTYPKYRGLPEEKDAWDTGDATNGCGC